MRIPRSPSIALPLLALFAAAISALALAAHAGLAFCNARIAVPMPGMDMSAMPGMDMSGSDPSGVLMVCPVVLVLILACTSLAFAAVVAVWRDPQRGLTRRTLARALSRLPLARTAAAVMLAGTIAFGVMLAADGAGIPALPVCALLAGLLVAGALAAALFSIAAGRLALALGRGLALALIRAIGLLAARRPVRRISFVPPVAGAHAVLILAAGRGLRAPPSFVR